MRKNPAGVRIVHNKLLGGWYIVRGPHQTPLGGRFPSKEAALQHLQDQKTKRDFPRSNPARKYRGKHPFAIQEIAGAERGILIVRANNGMRVRVHAADVAGIMPKLGEDIRNYDMLLPDRGGVLKNPVRSREIVTLTGARSRRVFGYATPDTSRATLDAAALRLANAHREPIKVARVKVQARHVPREMPAKVRAYLANPAPSKLESDALRVFFEWQEHGKDAAAEMFAEIVRENDLKKWQASALGAEIAALMKSKKNPAPRRFNNARAETILASIDGYAERLREKGRPVDADNLERSAAKFYRDGDMAMLVRTLQTARMIQNPAPREAIDAAARRYTRFTGHRAARVEMLPFPSKPAAGLAVGPVLMLGYSATRDGKRENYLHKFAPHARPMLVAPDDGKTLHLLGGRYSFTERGIVDKRK
jgi:hypothetical protein